MALRIRKDGRILCAAMHPAEPGDTYLDDGIHYMLSAEKKLLVTEPMERHKHRGEWWWSGNVPPEIAVDEFYRASAGNNERTNKMKLTYGDGKLQTQQGVTGDGMKCLTNAQNH